MTIEEAKIKHEEQERVSKCERRTRQLSDFRDHLSYLKIDDEFDISWWMYFATEKLAVKFKNHKIIYVEREYSDSLKFGTNVSSCYCSDIIRILKETAIKPTWYNKLLGRYKS